LHLIFSEEEKKWIKKEPFNWTTKKNCPKDLRKKIKKKLEILKSEKV
jgi:hypothetical protein